MVVRKDLLSSNFNQYKWASYNIMRERFPLDKEQVKQEPSVFPFRMRKSYPSNPSIPDRTLGSLFW